MVRVAIFVKNPKRTRFNGCITHRESGDNSGKLYKKFTKCGHFGIRILKKWGIIGQMTTLPHSNKKKN
jgi:hypothetical protein